MTSKVEDGIFTQVVLKTTNLLSDEITLYSVDSTSLSHVGDSGDQSTLYSPTSNSMVGAGDLEYHPGIWRGFLKPPVSGKGIEFGDLALEVFATQTGGQVFNTSNDLVDQLDHCMVDADKFYRISFDPTPASKPNEYHPLTITTAKPGLIVRTRTGYYAQP